MLSRREHASDWFDQMRAEYAHLPFDESWDLITRTQDAGECPEGAYHRLDVYRTPSADAIPLPDVFFDGPQDRLFEPDEAGAACVQVRGPQRDR